MGQIIEFPGAQTYDVDSGGMRRLTPEEVRQDRQWVAVKRFDKIQEMLDWIETQIRPQGNSPTKPAA